MRWLRTATFGYLLTAALQGLFGFIAVGAVTRSLGLGGLADWGLQQLLYQLSTLGLAVGLPPIVAARAVRLSHDRTENRTYGTALFSIMMTSLLAVTLVLATLGPRDVAWVVVSSSAAAAVLQVASAQLRGSERHGTNVLTLSIAWPAAYGGGLLGLLTGGDIGHYWLGFLAGMASAALLGVCLAGARPIIPRRQDARALLSAAVALPHNLANLLLTGLLRPLAGLLAGPGAVAAMTVATQYAQAGGVVHQAFWAARGPQAVRLLAEEDFEQLKTLRRVTLRTMAGLWLAHSLMAPPMLAILLGEWPSTEMLIASVALGGLPLFSTWYDLYAGILWRNVRGFAMSIISFYGLVVVVVVAPILALTLGPAYMPLSALAGRAVQGLLVRQTFLKGP